MVTADKAFSYHKKNSPSRKQQQKLVYLRVQGFESFVLFCFSPEKGRREIHFCGLHRTSAL